ncbi:MAG: Asp-tRNA(Asn)/Glu-tRNA(Gln) amidotransferase subunit GatC [Methanoregulaceae archaeon]|jgi:aspartyl-tRNA(Asn)/glutamyl-tRNA(Gln) amidotransferase subunit C|nr:Asp-tRNA(Asn)/Glu-tRNA(Gln) amidotransferase subunit GatC [Methanoregulaceae archaeon]
MVTERDVEHIAELADIGIRKEELGAFTGQFNAIIDYFDILDQVPAGPVIAHEIHNVLREDEVTPPLQVQEVLMNAGEHEDEFFKAPRVM